MKNKKKINPFIVYTHNFNDLNIDHKKVAEATLTAFRPTPESKVLEFRTFEVPSSTDYYQLKMEKILYLIYLLIYLNRGKKT